jgi:mannosyl-3-phosphoglycerate phosphatase
LRSKHVVFTDLDGSMLDHHTYSWEAAHPAIRYLNDLHIPLVFVTSKTRAETEYWRDVTRNRHPYIIENGAAVYIPEGSLPSVPPVIKWGTPYTNLVSALRDASIQSNCPVRGFADMSVDEVAKVCELDQRMAGLAKQREYDEPFVILDPAREGALVAAIEGKGLTCTRGGRFHHITGRNDKGVAVHTLKVLYEVWYGPLLTIGLGDGWNDLPMLSEVDIPVIMPSPDQEALAQRLPNAVMAPLSGPDGWNQMLLSLIREDGASLASKMTP